MRALLSSENFDGFGGTETYVLTVAQQLERLGHEAWIYSPNAGVIADSARDQGLRVVGRGGLPSGFDAVFVHDAATCFELAGRFHDATRVFVAHSRDHALQNVPQLQAVCDAVVVLNDRVRSSVEAQAAHPPVTRLRQPIDVKRFDVPGPPRRRTRRVLVSTNYVSGTRAELLERACRESGLEVDWIGATSRTTSSPELMLAEADIVIGLGRSVLEAMAAGRAAYVYGSLGGDGWVTPEAYPALESDGFAGLSNGGVIDGSRMAADLKRWHPGMGELNRDLACVHHAARDHAVELVSLVRGLAHASVRDQSVLRTAPLPTDELARLVRLEWQMYRRAVEAEFEAEHVRLEREQYRQDAERANARAAESEQAANETTQRLSELLTTRRYRLGRWVAAPLDWLRSHRSST